MANCQHVFEIAAPRFALTVGVAATVFASCRKCNRALTVRVRLESDGGPEPQRTRACCGSTAPGPHRDDCCNEDPALDY